MTEHEELLMLRELVKKQEAELEKKDQKIEQQNIRIENMVQALLHARKKIFGPSSEVTKEIDGQISLFPEEQKIIEELLKQKKKITIPTHNRVVRQPGVREEMLAGIPVEVVRLEIDEKEICNQCGSSLKVIGTRYVRSEVVYEKAKIKVVQYLQEVAKCTSCGTKDSDYPKDVFRKAATPTPLLPHSLVSASTLAWILYQKYQMGLPLNRLETDWYQLGFVLSKSTMANWVIRCSEDWLTPIYNRIHKEILKSTVLHMDETTIQCNKEPGKKPSSNSYMWVMCSGAEEENQALYFYYTRTRNGDHAKRLLDGYSNYYVTDAYAGYNKVDNSKRSLCFAHLRRYYIEAIPLDNRGKEIPGSKAAEGREFCNLLFKIESEIANLTPDERKKKRQEASRPILDALWSWAEETSYLYTTNEKLTTALTYTKNQRKHLETFIEDGRIPLSNNRVESHIKPFCNARKSWLFADTPKGATASALVYSIVETAKANQLNTFEYLKYLLTNIPNLDIHNYPETLESYLPWSKELPQECRLPEARKKKS